jgi:ubiquinol-cytochrome c reductase cytochrome c subunit
MRIYLAGIGAVLALAQTPGNSANGKLIYIKDGCYQCHGYAGQGGRDGPRIAATPLSAQALTRYVRRPFGAMPAFTSKVLPDQELADIYAYLKSVPVAAPAKEIPLLKQLQ